MKPIIGNAKTMFKVMNEFKRQEKTNQNVTANNQNNKKKNEEKKESSLKEQNINQPTFFM